MKINVISGDVTRIRADALVTAINSGRMWMGGIDGAIMRVAGNLFHNQASANLPDKQGGTVVAKANGSRHHGEFSNVVFVVDDLSGPLHEIIRNGLDAAAKEGFKTVTLPTIRMGVMLGVVEKSKEEAVDEMVKGVKSFLEKNPKTSIEHITFVVYIDPDTEEMLQRKLVGMDN